MRDDLPRIPCPPLAAMPRGQQLATLATARSLLDPRMAGLDEAVAHYDSVQDAIADAAELHLQRAIHHATTPGEREAIAAAIAALRTAVEGCAAPTPALAVVPGGKP